MPKVCFRTNLGSVDARELELDFEKCLKGTELDVSDALARRLCTPDPRTKVQFADLVVPSGGGKVKAIPTVEVKT